jgi:hypothetical protein
MTCTRPLIIVLSLLAGLAPGSTAVATAPAVVAPAAVAPVAAVAPDPLVGRYRRPPVENDWHRGRITREAAGRYRWTNDAGATWTLTPTEDGAALVTGPGNPYAGSAGGGLTTFDLRRSDAGVQGFWFGDDLFMRDGVELLGQRGGGLKGYISASLAEIPPGHGHGVSFHVSVWSLLEEPLAGFQIGLPSTWITPDNRDFTEPLCPPGTVARDNWPERGPTWDSVFQTIEGGLGFWGSTRFPSPIPKYRINGTANGYNHEISSPGWGFGRTDALTPEETGIAQLSNRLLIPPDGLTFRADTTGGLIGNAWMDLPLVPARDGGAGREDAGTPTGGQCWTLFLESAGFRGPVAFWVPETWSRLSRGYPTINGRGLDARPGLMNGGAMEVNTVPYFTAEDARGVTWARIPRINFPVAETGRTILFQDVALHSEATLHDAVARWFTDRGPLSGRFAEAGTVRPALRSSPIRFRQGPDDVPMVGWDALVATAIERPAGRDAFALRWTDAARAGRFPEYWRRDGDRMVPADAADVPAETRLREQTFARPRRFPAYGPPADPVQRASWRVADPRLGPFTAALSDGSQVTYAWFRFVDQPTLRHVNWSDAARADLQSLVEQIHRDWTIDRTYMHPPSRGELATFDDALIVSPPPGFEVGYVPVVLEQRMPPREAAREAAR